MADKNKSDKRNDKPKLVSTNPERGLRKQEVIRKNQRKDGDVGSPEVQVALLTSRIEMLTGHFEKHREDKHSQSGMLRLISRRKKLLTYLKDQDINRYRNTLAALGLRK